MIAPTDHKYVHQITSAEAAKPDLSATAHPYRVMKGGVLIGQFSNLPLAEQAACEHRGVIVDMSTNRVIYKDGRMLETE